MTIPGRRCARRHLAIESEGGGTGEERMTVKYAVIFERARSNWAAYVPDLRGCMTTGKTLEETEANISGGHRRPPQDIAGIR